MIADVAAGGKVRPGIPRDLDSEAAAWRAGARGLARRFVPMVNERRGYGRYRTLAERTPRGKARVVKTPLTGEVLEAHFRGEDVGDLLGLHAAGLAHGGGPSTRWVAVDIDRHDPEKDDPDANLRAALAWTGRLSERGIGSTLTDSDGRGGLHLAVRFTRPVPVADAHALLRWLTWDAASHGVRRVDLFPGSPELGPGGWSVWLRLPGRHHTHAHWSGVWDGAAFAYGEAAVRLLLDAPLVDPALIPPEALERPSEALRGREAGGKPRARPGGNVRAGRAPDDDSTALVRQAEWEAILTVEGNREEILRDVLAEPRWEPPAVGARNDVLVKLLAHLANRRLRRGVIAETAAGWWKHWHARGRIGTDPTRAPHDIEKALRSMFRATGFRPKPRLDHDAERDRIAISPAQSRMLDDPGLIPGISSSPPLPPGRNRGDTLGPLKRGARDYVEAWIVWATYQRRVNPGAWVGEVKATDRQIGEVILRRTGRKLDKKQLQRYRLAFFARGSSPASRIELGVVVETGGRGKSREPGWPTRYRLTGLGPLLDAGGVETSGEGGGEGPP